MVNRSTVISNVKQNLLEFPNSDVRILTSIVIYSLTVILLLTTQAVFAEQKTASIAAVIRNQVITKGDLDEQFNFLMLNGLFPAEDSLKADSLKLVLLDELINKRILIEYARKESIEVVQEEIDDMFENALEDMKSRFPDEETFKQQLSKEGLSFETFKNNYKKQISENLLLQRLMQKEFGSEMLVSEKEILEFYQTNKDSFAQPQKVKIAHILIIPKPSKDEEARIENKIKEVSLRLEFNENFDELVKKYSEGNLKNKNGDLGFVTRQDLAPEIADAAFSLAIDQVTLARGRDGIYLFKCIAKKSNSSHLKRIFFNLRITSIDTLKAYKLAKKVEELAQNEVDFSTLVKRYSDDVETKDKAGLLGEIYLAQLNPLFRDAVKNLDEGGVSNPVKTEFGFHVFKVLSKPDPRTPELDEIKDIVKNFVIQKRTKQKTDELLKRILPDFYVKNFLKNR